MPMYSPNAAAFKQKDVDIQEYEEYLFSEGLITEDMSERIVAFLPKGLSDSTMRGSRESLRSSKESLRESQESLLPPPGVNGDNSVTSGSIRDSVNTPTGKHGQAHWKLFRRSWAIGDASQKSDSFEKLSPDTEWHRRKLDSSSR